MMKRLFFLLTVVSLSLIGCNNDTCNEPLAFNYDPNGTSAEDCIWEPLNVHIDFNTTFGVDQLVLDQDYKTSDGREISFHHFGVYLTEISFLTDEEYIRLGSETSDCVDRRADAHLLLDSNRTYTGVILPSGNITAVRFNVGVDTCRNNNLDPTTVADGPFAPQFPTMYWAWATGYRFISLSGFVDNSVNGDGSSEEAFEYHLGLNQYLNVIELQDPELIQSGTDLRMTVNVDIEKLLEGFDFTTDLVTHTGNNIPLAEKISNNVEGAFSLD